MDYLLLLASFVLLIYSGKYLVKASVSLARQFRLSRLLIGLTVVAMGTSAPELLVSLNAAITGHPDIAVYNVIGSNISNIALVLGTAALIFPLAIRPGYIGFDWSSMMVALVFLFLFMLDHELGRVEGMLLVLLLILYIVLSVRKSRATMRRFEPEVVKGMNVPVFLSVIIIVISSAGLAFSADLLVKKATVIAMGLGISERLISVTFVAVGTSVPELTTSVIAALRREPDISVGNVVGSNIFNVFFVLGITALSHPVGISPSVLQFDFWWVVGFSAVLFLLLLVRTRGVLSRFKAFLLFFAYFVYLYLIFDKIG